MFAPRYFAPRYFGAFLDAGPTTVVIPCPDRRRRADESSVFRVRADGDSLVETGGGFFRSWYWQAAHWQAAFWKGQQTQEPGFGRRARADESRGYRGRPDRCA